MNQENIPNPEIKSEPTQVPIQPAPQPMQQLAVPITRSTKEISFTQKINRIMALVLIFSGISFVLVAILSIWEVFGSDTGDVVWKALGSLGAIALGALIVSVASKLVDGHHKL